jgi:hypothetical protein
LYEISHRRDGAMPHAATARGLVYTTSAFQKRRLKTKALPNHGEQKQSKIDPP